MTIAVRMVLWPALLLGMALLPGAMAADDTAVAEPAAGQLLVASARMQDPRFAHSVILMLRHDRRGAFGLAINRPIGERPLAEILGAISRPKDGDADRGAGAVPQAPVDGAIPVFLGGPVQPQLGFVIHTPEYHRAETTVVGDGLAMTASKEVLADIARRQGPAKFLFALGYAGWGPNQLEGEIARRDWFVVPAEPGLVFDAARDAVWDKALASRTREL